MNGRLVFCAVLVLAACGGGEDPAGPPAAIEDLSGAALTGVVGQQLADPLRVRVTDAEGRGVSGVAVNFVVAAGGGQITDVPVASTSSGALLSVVAIIDSTDENGEARALWTLGPTVGEQRATVSAPGLTAVNILADATPGEPALLFFTNASAFIGVAGQAAEGSIVARVTDEFDNPLDGVLVTWGVAEGGGSVGAANSTTNASGDAQTSVVLGPAQGLHLFTAVAGGTEPDTIGVVAVVGTTDPTGDAESSGDPAFADHDVTFFGAATFENVIVTHFRFAGEVVAPTLSGSQPSRGLLAHLDFDADRDSLTGRPAQRRCFEADSLGFGADVLVLLDPGHPLLDILMNEPRGAVPVLRVDSLVDAGDPCGGLYGVLTASVPAYSGTTVSLAMPLSFFDDQSDFGFTGLFGSYGTGALTDVVPDSLAHEFTLSASAAMTAAAPTASRARFIPPALGLGTPRPVRFDARLERWSARDD